MTMQKFAIGASSALLLCLSTQPALANDSRSLLPDDGQLLAQSDGETGQVERRRRGAVPQPVWIGEESPEESQGDDENTPSSDAPSRPAPAQPAPAAAPAPTSAPPEFQPVKRRRVITEPAQPQPTSAPAVMKRPTRPAESAPEVPDAVKPEFHEFKPDMDSRVKMTTVKRDGFRSDPTYPDEPYNVEDQLAIYGGKYAVSTPRPLIELGYPMYAGGVFGQGHNIIGRKNLVRPQTLLYGDWRTAVGTRKINDQELTQLATRLNLDLDIKLTATERLHALFRPLEEDGRFTRSVFTVTDAQGNNIETLEESEVETDGTPVTLFLEGDVGQIWAGLTDEYNLLDLPFSVGLMPLLTQNGIWLDDAFRGAAFSIPAMNSPKLFISNMDLSFYFGYDDITTRAVDNANEDDTKLVAVAAFVERLGSYWEASYGYVQDDGDDPVDRSYHNLSLAWTRRFGAALSHSSRVIANFGQEANDSVAALPEQTADGVMLLLENSLITSKPYTFIPYFNFFFGIDQPQGLAKAEGLLKNTGINYEADAITGFPALDDSGHNAFGGAVGLQYLFNLNRQVVFELAGTSHHGDDADIKGNEYAVGFRFQQPFLRQLIFRVDAMAGIQEAADNMPNADDTDLFGVRAELRAKF